MDTSAVRRYWELNAPAWTRLTRQGYDTYRDALNTPAFLSLLPDVAGLRGLDIGCGEGHNTRLLVAERGARMTAADISAIFLDHANHHERENPLGIRYVHTDGSRLPFAAGMFDFVTAFMSLMDMPHPEAAIGETYRVLRSGGFLQFSITHPCFFPPYRRHLRDADGTERGAEVGRYFDNVDGEVERWLFTAAPPEEHNTTQPFEIPRFHRTLSQWLNAVSSAGFVLEQTAEPSASTELVKRVPALADTRQVAYFLHVRCRKPG